MTTPSQAPNSQVFLVASIKYTPTHKHAHTRRLTCLHTGKCRLVDRYDLAGRIYGTSFSWSVGRQAILSSVGSIKI